MSDFPMVNRATLDEPRARARRVAGCGFDRFAAAPAFPSDVVRFDLPRLGDVTRLRGVHPQCHIGPDTAMQRAGREQGGRFSRSFRLEMRECAPYISAWRNVRSSSEAASPVNLRSERLRPWR
jgi:hypothetical protein